MNERIFLAHMGNKSIERRGLSCPGCGRVVVVQKSLAFSARGDAFVQVWCPGCVEMSADFRRDQPAAAARMDDWLARLAAEIPADP